MKVMAVVTSPNKESHSLLLARRVAASAERHGATIDWLVLADTPLPMMSLDGHGEHEPHVDDVAKRMRAAEGFIVASPEYHGSMSGMAKNFFDHGYHEFSGKLFALVCSTGGSQGTSAMTHMRATVQYCHGWTLPYQVGVMSRDFNDQNELTNISASQRLEFLGRDLVVYGRMLHEQFARDVKGGAENAPSFAQWHAKALA